MRLGVAKDVLWVGPLTAFVLVGTFFSGGGADGLTAWQWTSVALAGAASLSLLVVRHRPRLGVVLPGLLAGTYLACGFPDGPVYLPLLLGAHLTARSSSVRRWLPWTTGALLLTVAGMAVRAATTGLGWWQPLGQSVGVAALTATAATLGSLVRSRQQTAAERAARAATEEQLRMAQDLHDGVGHGLAVIAMQAGVALHVLERDPAGARESLEAIRETSRESLDALRAELSKLSGAAPRIPRRGLADLGQLVDRVAATGLVVRVTGDLPGDLPDDLPGDLPGDVGHAAYLIVQEALTNVLRHARARVVDVGVRRSPGALVVTVVDDGVGGPVHDEGMGITGMRQRAEALGGSLAAGPHAGGGFEVTAELPR